MTKLHEEQVLIMKHILLCQRHSSTKQQIHCEAQKSPK